MELAHAVRVSVAPPGFFVGERSRWLLPSERDELTAEPPDHRPHAPPASSAADDLIAIVTRVCDPGGSVAAGVVPVSGSFSSSCPAAYSG